MDWNWTNNWCDECPAMDIHRVAEAIADMVSQHGGHLTLTVDRLRNQIMEYITWRLRKAQHELSVPQHDVREPAGWTDHAERVWQDWVTDTFQVEEWVAAVITPIFGTDERNWEARTSTRWRTEILTFLPYWIERSWDIVDTYDPTPPTFDTGSEEEVVAMDTYDGRRRR